MSRSISTPHQRHRGRKCKYANIRMEDGGDDDVDALETYVFMNHVSMREKVKLPWWLEIDRMLEKKNHHRHCNAGNVKKRGCLRGLMALAVSNICARMHYCRLYEGNQLWQRALPQRPALFSALFWIFHLFASEFVQLHYFLFLSSALFYPVLIDFQYKLTWIDYWPGLQRVQRDIKQQQRLSMTAKTQNSYMETQHDYKWLGCVGILLLCRAERHFLHVCAPGPIFS